MSDAALDAEVHRVGSRDLPPFDLFLAHCILVRLHNAASLAFVTVSMLAFESRSACVVISKITVVVIQGMRSFHFTTFVSLQETTLTFTLSISR